MPDKACAKSRKDARPAVSGGDGPLGAFGLIRGEGAIEPLLAVQRGLGDVASGECKCAQHAQEAGQMAMIVNGIGLLGLLAVVGRGGRRLVRVVVMAEVLGGMALIVPAIVGTRRPGDLEREQA